MDFEGAVAWLNERSIPFRQGDEYVGEHGVGEGRHKVDRPYIEALEVPLTAEEWLDIMSTDGEFLGACCGTISSARDILIAQVRHGRWIDTKDLWEFIEILSHHDGFEFMLPKTHENYREWSTWYEDMKPQDDPIYRIWETWDAIKEHALLEVPHADPYPENSSAREPVKAALNVLYDGVFALYWGTSCFSEESDNDPDWMKQQKHARRQLTIARLLPALRGVLDHIDTLDMGDFKGFAVCKIGEPDDVCRNRLGQCIYHTEEEAQKMIDRWAKRDDENEEDFGRKDIRKKAIIRPVSVSSETGLTFLDEEN